MNKSKNELIAALKTINQVCELKVIRKAVSFQTEYNDDKQRRCSEKKIPYHNEIFAKNSIKLPVKSCHYHNKISSKYTKNINKKLTFTDENGMYLLFF